MDQANVDSILGLEVTDGTSAGLGATLNIPKKGVRGLSEDHLLSVRGLKKVRLNAPNQLRKRLNHKDEYKNLTNLLAYYQLWGHDVFPKANFKDFLTMCSTVGSKRRVLAQRREWVQEDLDKQKGYEYSSILEARRSANEESREHASDDEAQPLSQSQKIAQHTTEPRPATSTTSTTHGLFVGEEEGLNDDDDDDDLYTTISSRAKSTAAATTTIVDPSVNVTNQARLGLESSGSDERPNQETVSESHQISKEPSATSPTGAVREKGGEKSVNGKGAGAENEEDIPNFDEFGEENFEDAYAAEMEAMDGYQ